MPELFHVYGQILSVGASAAKPMVLIHMGGGKLQYAFTPNVEPAEILEVGDRTTISEPTWLRSSDGAPTRIVAVEA